MLEQRPVLVRIAADAPVIEVVAVRKSWPQRGWFARRTAPPTEVFRDVNCVVRRGEIVVVLGENGAGKTTLLKIVGGLARPDEGQVRVYGSDGRAWPARYPRLAYAGGGERGFYYRLTARENLTFFGALDGLHRRQVAERICEVARVVDIERELDKTFAELSSGLRQRLAIARALLNDPEILLLDEPTRALDPPHAADLRRFIRTMLAQRCGKTVIVATNLIEEAIELGDRIAVLRRTGLHFVGRLHDEFAEGEIRRLLGMAERA